MPFVEHNWERELKLPLIRVIDSFDQICKLEGLGSGVVLAFRRIFLSAANDFNMLN